jgi:hypothetical protein
VTGAPSRNLDIEIAERLSLESRERLDALGGALQHGACRRVEPSERLTHVGTRSDERFVRSALTEHR